MMDRAEREAWKARGKQDPVVAYRTHAVTAAKRGIEFKLTFAQWWAIWQPHYAERGRAVGQKCMCRNGDAGAYEVGNVRIDTVLANAQERSAVFRSRNLSSGRLPTAEDRHPLAYQAPDDWLTRRKWVFKQYDDGDDSL